MAERVLAALCLAGGLGGVWWFAFPKRPGARSHGRWLWRATLGFVVPALVGLVLLGRLDALVAPPAEFAEVARVLPQIDAVRTLPALAAGMPLGAGVVWLQIWWARRRGRPVPRHIVAPAPLAARDRRELLPATATAVWAGVSEELAFRLFLPLAATLSTGNAWVGFGLATAAFVGLHRYQPWWGQLGVLATAVALTALWLMTGALWLAMLVHALIDVMALAVRPWLAGFGR